MAGSITITWHGHSCFTLERDGYRLVLDPYEDGSVRGLPRLRLEAEEVLCSHRHHDHDFTDGVTLTKSHAPSPFTVSHFDIPHDDAGGKLRGMVRVYIFEAGGLRVAHLGDIGCMPAEAQLDMLKNLDCMLIPVGGFFTINAKNAKVLTDLTSPRVIVPMHYRGKGFGLPVIGKVTDFTELFDQVTFSDSSVLTLEADKPAGVVVLKCPEA